MYKGPNKLAEWVNSVPVTQQIKIKQMHKEPLHSCSYKFSANAEKTALSSVTASRKGVSGKRGQGSV